KGSAPRPGTDGKRTRPSFGAATRPAQSTASRPSARSQDHPPIPPPGSAPSGAGSSAG
ncbi:MAG: hypothetical protein AVDCRST_MAG25-2954, partial [uncultured Rubrobacteraceae bacterium]